MTELQPIIDLLVAKWPWLIHLATFIGFARLVAKPIGNWLKDWIARAAQKAVDSKPTWDDHWIEVLFDAPLYRLFVFLLDLFVSVKLPVKEDLITTKPPL